MELKISYDALDLFWKRRVFFLAALIREGESVTAPQPGSVVTHFAKRPDFAAAAEFADSLVASARMGTSLDLHNLICYLHHDDQPLRALGDDPCNRGYVGSVMVDAIDLTGRRAGDVVGFCENLGELGHGILLARGGMHTHAPARLADAQFIAKKGRCDPVKELVNSDGSVTRHFGTHLEISLPPIPMDGRRCVAWLEERLCAA